MDNETFNLKKDDLLNREETIKNMCVPVYQKDTVDMKENIEKSQFFPDSINHTDKNLFAIGDRAYTQFSVLNSSNKGEKVNKICASQNGFVQTGQVVDSGELILQRERYPSECIPSERYPSERYPSECIPSERYPSERYPSERYPSEHSSESEPTLGEENTPEEYADGGDIHLNGDKKWGNKRGKKKKKGVNLNYIVHYNRYQPTRIPIFKKNNIPMVKKNKIKNQYINCNFRYYVKEKNYLTHNVDDNINWEQIEKVDYIIFDHICLTCPICLENNIISPRITKCRHIFCFFCILKYFIDEEKKTWKKCPICFEIINENDLRSVKFHYVKNYNIKDNINLCLLYTENKKINLKSNRLFFNNTFNITNNNFVKKKVQNYEKNKIIDYKYILNIDYMNKNLITFSKNHSEQILKLNLNLGVQFSKFFYIYNPLALWIKDLNIFNFILINKKKNILVSDDNIIQKAIQNIKLKISDYLNIPIEEFNPELHIDENTFDCFYLYDNLAHDVYGSIEQIRKEMEMETELSKGHKLEQEKRRNSTLERSNSEQTQELKYVDQTYFYQCIDGQCIFLDPFILKLLFFECDNDMNRMPKFLCNRKITYIESFELDEKTRNRYPILSHLPLGVNVLFISVNLDDILSEKTKKHFAKEITERRKKHITTLRKKVSEEKYFKLLAEEEIDRKEKQYWNLPSNTISIQNDSIGMSSNSLRISNHVKGEKYFHGELYDATMKFGSSPIVEELENVTNLDNVKYKDKMNEHVQRNDCSCINPNWKKKNAKKNNTKYSNDETSEKNVKWVDETNNGVKMPKSTFLEIAKRKCDVNDIKLDEFKKKEENFSLGTGPVSINLMDLISKKTPKKKKKK
ncbi:E3 ubiquitin-protein ligase, putative [Plasmodium ovale]|uniref:E3 ubiquitin-protein ligase, putative n=1 Tax=Plasmodium ovale TaxID=36330 RepID=A0A1D3TGN0_PLAOA|nr:E3 ubiquitin-protein ligase, putative [Plasmodium ovale]